MTVVTARGCESQLPEVQNSFRSSFMTNKDCTGVGIRSPKLKIVLVVRRIDLVQVLI